MNASDVIVSSCRDCSDVERIRGKSQTIIRRRRVGITVPRIVFSIPKSSKAFPVFL